MGKNRSPEPVFELPAHFTEWSGREGGPVGRPLARLWLPFGRARAALQAATCPEGRPERRPFFCKGRPHFEGGRPAATRAAPPATMGGPSAQRRPHSGRPQFEGGRPEGGPAAQARRPGRPIGPPDFRGWPPTFGWRAARFWSEGRPIWRLGGPGGGRAARSPLTADSTTYGTPVPKCTARMNVTRDSLPSSGTRSLR